MVDLCNDLLSIKEGQKKEFTLHSGNKVSFIKAKIPHKRIQDLTFVNQKTNVRDQESLTEESLADIIKTIKLQQFFPVIGRRLMVELKFWMALVEEHLQYMQEQILKFYIQKNIYLLLMPEN